MVNLGSIEEGAEDLLSDPGSYLSTDSGSSDFDDHDLQQFELDLLVLSKDHRREKDRVFPVRLRSGKEFAGARLRGKLSPSLPVVAKQAAVALKSWVVRARQESLRGMLAR